MVVAPSIAEAVFNFVETCDALASVDAVLSALRKETDRLGISSFIITGLPLPKRPLEPLVLLNAWPKGWYDRYIANDYFSIDPVGQYNFVISSPFRWSEARIGRGADRIRGVMGEAAEFGLKDGYCVPIHSATGLQAAISFASDQVLDLSVRDMAAAHLLALTAHGRLQVLMGASTIRSFTLTPREREVLTWAAAGKTAWETSTILRISEATVITHLDNIRRKFNVANTTQAVTQALQSGELQPY
jgi:LuxR family quorum sensing-dependent transcriptional regulator